MEPYSFVNAALLGILEGLTEFLPISSTGHLILTVDLLKFNLPPGRVFEIVIQFGAIMAVIVVYFSRLWGYVRGALKGDKGSIAFIRNLMLAFFPAIIVGFFARDYIKAHFFNPTTVSIALIVGGIIILLIEKYRPTATIKQSEDMSWRMALGLGVFQCLAMIPGTSRSGATIMGALLCGMERKAAAEFSFFLAIPTMLAAASFDLYKNMDQLSMDGAVVIAVGFVAAFITALFVVRWVVGFVGKHGFGLFAWYRIALGSTILSILYLT
jgi:undecaprenyl-diphosphatase